MRNTTDINKNDAIPGFPSAEIPHLWRVTSQIWVVLLIGLSKFPTRHNHESDTLPILRRSSALVSQTLFRGETSGGVGLDTNITKNRLNMFPEIPDFFLYISKSSQYLKKIFGYLYLGYCNYVCAIRIPPPISLWLSVDWAVRFPPVSAKRKRTGM